MPAEIRLRQQHAVTEAARRRKPSTTGTAIVLSVCMLGVWAVLSSLPKHAAQHPVQELHAKDHHMAVARSMAAAAAVGGTIPKILHQMHANLSALNPLQALLRDKCIQLHPEWAHPFWDDAALHDFVRTEFAEYYPTWININPLIKQLDTSRYMLMHRYGGIYVDVDVECVTPFDSLIQPLPRGAAWLGDFPEPMFLMSAPKAKFWLQALDRIKRVWDKLDAWKATGPAGINQAAIEWTELHGSGSLVPFVTNRAEPAFHAYIKNKNNTIPWFELANGNIAWDSGAEGGSASLVWKAPSYSSGRLSSSLRSTPAVERDMTLGFVANELLDPVSCSADALRHCVDSFCNASWPLAYTVHHCINSWRGRIGT